MPRSTIDAIYTNFDGTSGFTDLTNFSGSPSWVSAIGQGLSSSHGSLARTRASSPVYNVAAGDPPFLIIHGADDWFIAPLFAV